MKKNISYKYSAQFELVITKLETDIASRIPMVLQVKVYQTPFSLPLWRNSLANLLPLLHRMKEFVIKPSYSSVRNLPQSAEKHCLSLPSSK